MVLYMENNKIDYRLDKCRYACGQLYIRESMHVADGMDECIIAIADKIFPILSRLIDKLNIRNSLSLKGAERENEFERIDNELAEFGLIYSGWNFNPNYIDDMKYNIEHGIVGTPCLELNDESEPYPIYIDFLMEESSTYAIVLNRERNDDVENDTMNRIIIRLNIRNIIPRIGWEKINIRRNVAHELQHAFDMYIIKDKNFIENDKKQGMTLSMFDDGFILNEQGRYFVNAVLGLMTPDEQRARLAELEHLLKCIESDKDFANAMFCDGFNNRDEIIIDRRIGNPPRRDYRDDLVRYVANNRTIQSITRVNRFRDILGELIRIKEMHKPTYDAIILIIGYYMFKHSVFKFIGYEGSEIKKLFKNKNNLESIIRFPLSSKQKARLDSLEMMSDSEGNYDDIIDFVFKTIKDEFCHYVALVNGKLLVYEKSFFKWGYIKDITEGFRYAPLDSDVLYEEISDDEIYVDPL